MRARLRGRARGLLLSVALLVVLAAGTGPAPVGSAMAGVAYAAEAAAILPSGFVLTPSPTGQTPYNLTDFAYLPDGSMITTGKDGTVTWAPVGGAPRVIAHLPVITDLDLGLVTVAPSIDHAETRQVYTARALDAGDGRRVTRLSRWTLATDVGGQPSGLVNEVIVLETSADANQHVLTGVVPAADGTLWVSIGDSSVATRVDTRALRALDPDDPHGKLLHILPDGRGVPSNPYYAAATPRSWRSRVFASGFRSPFRITLDPASGTPIVGDVGWDDYEEINLVRPGASYGWPCWEGPQPTRGYRDLPECAGVGHTPPLWSYGRDAGGSVTGGLVYTGQSYPAAYRGAYFFGDYASQHLWTLTFDPTGRLTRSPEPGGFSSLSGGLVKLAAGPGGDVVLADLSSGNVTRLTYAAGNRPPTAQATTTTDPATRTVTFDASRSSDLDGDALTYAWDFGDTTSGSGIRTSHTYDPGDAPVTARLTVTDTFGNAANTQITVVPFNHPPVLSLSTPADRTYAVGDTVTATATAMDAEDGPLPIRWRTDLVHCRGLVCHSHPGPSIEGPEYALAFSDHGDDTRMEVTASSTDRYGVVTEQTFVARPTLRLLTLASSTPAVMTLNGRDATTALLTVGSTNSLAAAATATDGVATFDRWDDSASRQRTLAMPDRDVTLDARYATPVDRRYAGDARFRSLLGAPLGSEQGDAGLRWRDFQTGRAYWSPSTGVHELHGDILRVYLRLRGHAALGPPITDETPTPDGVGRFNHFSRGGSIYWSLATGAHGIGGAIRQRWEATGWERGPLGYPVTDETPTPDGVGRFNHFSRGGSIYWSPGSGAWEIYGAIRVRWAALGWERSWLGYPVSGEFPVPEGRRSNFQNGYVLWDAFLGTALERGY